MYKTTTVSKFPICSANAYVFRKQLANEQLYANTNWQIGTNKKLNTTPKHKEDQDSATLRDGLCNEQHCPVFSLINDLIAATMCFVVWWQRPPGCFVLCTARQSC